MHLSIYHTQLILNTVIHTAYIDTGHAMLSRFSEALRKLDPTFDNRNFGYSTFRKFCDALRPDYVTLSGKGGLYLAEASVYSSIGESDDGDDDDEGSANGSGDGGEGSGDQGGEGSDGGEGREEGGDVREGDEEDDGDLYSDDDLTDDFDYEYAYNVDDY